MSRDIRFKVTDEEYTAIDKAARDMGIGGQSPASVLASMSTRQRAGLMALGGRCAMVSLDRVEYELLSFYSEVKGHKGPEYVEAYLHYAGFQLMSKYSLSEPQKAEFRKRYADKYPDAQAVQPEAEAEEG